MQCSIWLAGANAFDKGTDRVVMLIAFFVVKQRKRIAHRFQCDQIHWRDISRGSSRQSFQNIECAACIPGAGPGDGFENFWGDVGAQSGLGVSSQCPPHHREKSLFRNLLKPKNNAAGINGGIDLKRWIFRGGPDELYRPGF